MVARAASRDDASMEQEHSTIEDPAESPAEGTTAPDPTAGNRRWVRPRDGRLLAGVAAGIADRLDLPAWLVRVVFVALALADGVGILVYLGAWALMPEQGNTTSLADDFRARMGAVDRPSKVAGLVLIGVGTVIALGTTGLLGSRLFVAVTLAAAGVYLIGNR